jgi:hypothetical protein
VFPIDDDERRQPDDDQQLVEHCELRHAEGEAHADEDEEGLKHIANPPEKPIDDLLGLIFGRAAGRQEQRVTCRVLQ